jgi:hypothetical protein
MSRYTLVCEQHDGTTITVETEKECITDLLESIEQFLLGCGYAIKLGSLQIVSEDEEESKEKRK